MANIGDIILQLVLLGVGWIFMIISGVLLIYALYWLATALHVPAIIIGVRKKGRILYPVFRYQMPDGSLHEAIADTGSSRMAGKETGRPVILRVDPEYPSEARRSIAGFFVGGVLFALPGVWFVVLAVTQYPVGTMTWVALTVLAALTTARIGSAMIRVNGRTGFDRFRDAMRTARQKRLGGGDMVAVEAYTSSPDKQKEAADIQYAAQSMGPTLLLAGMAAILYGVYLGNHEHALYFHGQKAEGTIVSFTQKDDARYPVITFDTVAGDTQQFESAAAVDDNLQTGDVLPVLYMAQDTKRAETLTALGLPLLPAFLLFGGTIALIAGFTATRKRHTQNRFVNKP